MRFLKIPKISSDINYNQSQRKPSARQGLLTLCDCHPEREQEMLSLLEEHMKQFNDLYQKEGGSL